MNPEFQSAPFLLAYLSQNNKTISRIRTSPIRPEKSMIMVLVVFGFFVPVVQVTGRPFEWKYVLDRVDCFKKKRKRKEGEHVWVYGILTQIEMLPHFHFIICKTQESTTCTLLCSIGMHQFLASHIVIQKLAHQFLFGDMVNNTINF